VKLGRKVDNKEPSNRQGESMKHSQKTN